MAETIGQALNQAIQQYETKWRTLVDSRQNKAFFESLRPVAIGWKVSDREGYTKCVAELHDKADMIIEKWMNGRWIAKVHLHDEKLANGAEIIKVMERRAGSTDAVGLDHVDFYVPTEVNLPEILDSEGLKWSEESNDVVAGYEWISLWFEGTEAKLKFGTVLDIIQIELKELNERITK